MEDSKEKQPENKKDLRVQQIRPPKLKDKPNRSRLYLNLKEVFGFIPEFMIIDKVPNVSNQIVISAVVPEVPSSKKAKDEDSKTRKGSKLPNKKGNSKE